MAKWVEGRGYGGMEERAASEAPLFYQGPQRFWMPPNTGTQIIFTDDDPLRYYEHGMQVGKSYRHWATCTGDKNTCPLCLIGHDPYYVAAWTVLDRTEWKDKKGVARKDEKRLYVCKQKVMVKLAWRSEKLRSYVDEKTGAPVYPGGLRGMVFEVRRGDGKSPNTGDDFDLIGQADDSLLVGADGKKIEPFDYMTVLAPDMNLLNKYADLLKRRANSPL